MKKPIRRQIAIYRIKRLKSRRARLRKDLRAKDKHTNIAQVLAESFEGLMNTSWLMSAPMVLEFKKRIVRFKRAFLHIYLHQSKGY